MLLSLGQILMQTISAPNIFEFIFGDNFFSMLMKEYVFVSRNFLLLHKLNKEDDLTSASYLHAGHLFSQGKTSQPFWLTNYNRGRKLLSLET